MSATAALREVPDMVPIEHETSERVVRTLVFGVPPAALAAEVVVHRTRELVQA